MKKSEIDIFSFNKMILLQKSMLKKIIVKKS